VVDDFDLEVDECDRDEGGYDKEHDERDEQNAEERVDLVAPHTGEDVVKLDVDGARVGVGVRVSVEVHGIVDDGTLKKQGNNTSKETNLNGRKPAMNIWAIGWRYHGISVGT
jgi:hypothetical protein